MLTMIIGYARYTGRSSETRSRKIRIENGQPIRSAITVAAIVGVACSNSRIRGSAGSTTPPPHRPHIHRRTLASASHEG